MTSLAIAKLACDALLFVSLIFLSLRLIRKQPNAGANILKLKELETSLKEVVREADEASQNFNNDLLTRKRDLERVLSDSQAIEGRINKSAGETNEALREALLIKQDLEKTIQNSIAALQQHESLIEKNIQRERDHAERELEQKTQAALRNSAEAQRSKFDLAEESQKQCELAPAITQRGPRVSGGKEIIPPAPSSSFEYDKMLEPPSFSQLSEATEKRVMARTQHRSALSERIERTTNTAQQGKSSHLLQDSLLSVASAAERSINATRLPSHLEQALASAEERTQSIRKEDPRLGVLGASRRSSQVV